MINLEKNSKNAFEQVKNSIATGEVMVIGGSWSACEQVKLALESGRSLFDMAIPTLMDALEIKMNSVGYTHHGLDTVYYDLYQIAEKLVEYYAHDAIKKQVAETIYEIDYSCHYDDADDA